MSRVSGYPSRPPSRPASEQLCDLHVYKVPLDLWRTPLNNILNQSVTDTVSLGIIRVPPDLPLIDLRTEITRQLEDQAPKDYVFLRSVGRSLTWLKSKQEIQLKAKHFLPPVHYAPELFLLEANPEMREALAISDRSSQQSPSSLHHGSTGHGYQNSNRGYGTYRDGYRNKDGYPGDRRTIQRASDRASPTRHYTPLPKIDASSSQPQSQEGSPAFFTDVGADSRDSFDNNNYHQPSTFRPDPRTRQRYKDREEDYSPSQDYDGHKENQQVAIRREDDKRYREHQHQHQQHQQHQQHTPQKDTYRRRENSDSETVSPHSPAERQPPRSTVHSPVRKGQAGSVHKGGNHERDAAYTTNTNEDSGVAGLTPEDQYKNRDKENFYLALQNKSKDMQNRLNRDRFNVDDDDDDRLKDMDERTLLDRERWEADQRDRRRRAAEDRYRSEEDRKREEEEERRRAEEEEERRRAEEDEEAEEAARRAEDAKSKGSNKRDLDRFPSPPTLRMSSPDLEIPRDTESARRRRRQEREKLLAELEDAKEARHGTEKEREELVKKAKNLQNKTQNRRNHARDLWKKKYFDEKKKTAPLEEQTNRLREDLETLHRKLMNTLEGPKEKNVKLGDKHPSQKNNFVIQCTKLQHEIDDLRRRVENAKMKLTAEMKLRNQAEAELRALRAELVQKKINLTLTRSQQFAALSPGMSNETLVKPAVPGIPHGKGEAQALQS